MDNQFTMKEQGTHNGERTVSSINGVGKISHIDKIKPPSHTIHTNELKMD